MKINISKATEKEIEKFNKKEWYEADIEHYGKPIKWISKPLVFKVKEKGTIIGSVKAHYDVGVVFIKNLIVAKNRRRQGIGRKLMDKVEKTGKQLGAHKLYLYTMEKWNSSKFYKSLGYEKTANLPKHYFKKDFVIYSKII